jgi:hypothetical protein
MISGDKLTRWTASMKPGHRVRRWPLALIASPAAVAIWSGWVGLGAMCGFGLVQPFPGIVGWHLDTAITLPVGVEAYGAYALGAWLSPGTPGPARTFARRSALGALVLGMGGQVIYHLLAAARTARAPWPVVVLVSCLPVVTLGFGAALTHLLRIPDAGETGPRDEPQSVPETVLPAVPEAAVPEVATTVHEAAKVAYIASVRGGNPVSERALADRFGITRPAARKLRAVVAAAANGHGAEST